MIEYPKYPKKKNRINPSPRLIFLCIILLVLFYAVGGYLFSPGSYPRAEDYEFTVSEKVLLEKIKQFKVNNPEYDIPKRFEEGGRFIDEKADSTEYWNHVYFYYPEEKQVAHTLVRGTTLSLLAIIDVDSLGWRKCINQDFGFWENIQQKKKFKERIVEKLRQ